MPASPISRRDLLAGSLAAGTGLFIASIRRALGDKREPLIVLRSGWQTINIGDVAHTPGVLALLEKHVPQAKLVLWANNIDRPHSARELLMKRFPKLNILSSRPDADGGPKDAKEREVVNSMDLLLHGSGPSVVAANVLPYAKKLNKPYGIYGVTLSGISDNLKKLLSDAAFVYTRETLSLEAMKEAGVTSPEMGFAPDGTFALDVRDDESAKKYMSATGLESGKFIVAIARLRFTPYPHYPEEERKRRAAVSAEFAEKDHAKLREAIITYVRKTGQKVLVCPEMTYQIEASKEHLVDPLPEDVKKLVVHRNTFWGPDEAASVYVHANLIVSFEMHSPIIGFAVGTPAMYLRQPTDTRKGHMMRDIGRKDWIFEIDETKGEEVAAAVMRVHENPKEAQAKVKETMGIVRERQEMSMAMVARAL